MKTSTMKSRSLAILASAALVATVVVAAPANAAATGPTCDGKTPVQTCSGTTSDGALYTMQVPSDWNGTALIYSHGYGFIIDIPAGVPVVGGSKVDNSAYAGPDAATDAALVKAGYAIMGSGFARQGWNIDSAVKTNVELVGVFKKQFPKVSKVIAWGKSGGAFITQSLAEKYPTLVDGIALGCPVLGTVEAELDMALDFLWGLKTFFDPTIKGGNYSAGAAGAGEAITDLVKMFTVIGKLQASISTNAWPDTSKAPDSIKAIPPRSALLLVGLMAGIPTKSTSFDSTTGPEGALKLTWPLAIAPAMAVLENGAQGAALAILATHDLELQAGGAFYDNSKTDYAARVADEAVTFNAALSGNTALNGLLSYLSPLNPAAPRLTANQAALAKLRALSTHTGKISVPTVVLAGETDVVSPAGNTQWLIDRYAEQSAAEKAAALKADGGSFKAPKNKLIVIWKTGSSSYSKFTAAGSPIPLVASDPNSNAHCNFSAAQHVALVKLAVQGATKGSVSYDGATRTVARKVMTGVIGPQRFPALQKFYMGK
jgi:pimeloyl-ACP methyl ester carboxylesterase